MIENQQSNFEIENSVDYSSARAIAISAGDLSLVVRREVKQTLEENRNNLLSAINSGLEMLSQRALISANERDELQGMCKHLIYAIRGKEDGEDAFLAIRSSYHDMLLNRAASPVALAIASTATSAFNIDKQSPVTIIPESTGAGAAVGSVIGGIVGGVVGGGLGAAIGAAVGGAAGAAIGWCNETGNGND